MEEFDHLKIKMEDIKSATNNFNPNKLIGRGGFGRVYEGELSLPEARRMVAFKRLDRRYGQGNTEFWKEIMMLSKYKHENLVSLMHFCNEGDEMILVYKHASRGSLDRYLSDASLTWRQRLKICIGVARALDFLHDPKETQQRIIHRDIKSSNILLDENWAAKVSDFGLSKVGPANQPHTYIFSNPVGTPGYCDPSYFDTGILSKESDVYSFGVVLFEIICGRLCFECHNGEITSISVAKWKKLYKDNRLDEIILMDLKEQMEPGSLSLFLAIAYRCVKKTREGRPTMAEIVKELEFVLEEQEVFENITKRVDFEEWIRIADLAVPPLSYRTRSQLFILLLKGILVDNGQTWLSLNKNEETCEIISATKCASSVKPQTAKSSRFLNVLFINHGIDLKVSTQFLSPHVTYTMHLVVGFDQSEMKPKYSTDLGTYVSCKYKLDGERHYWNSYYAIMRADGWIAIPLYQFTSCQKKHDFTINILSLSNLSNTRCFIESIEFQPVKNDTQENKRKHKQDMQPLWNSDTDLEEKLPGDYMDIINLSKDGVQWTTKKELYFLLRKGFLINIYGEKEQYWISINKHMKKRIMIPAKACFIESMWIWNPLLESRFGVVAECPDNKSGLTFHVRIGSKLLSPQTTYSCHLIYKPPKNSSLIEGQMNVWDRRSQSRNIYLSMPHIPIIGPFVDQKSRNQFDTLKRKGHPKQRKDGWMEVELWEATTYITGDIYENLHVYAKKNANICNYVGLVVQGIELRPL